MSTAPSAEPSDQHKAETAYARADWWARNPGQKYGPVGLGSIQTARQHLRKGNFPLPGEQETAAS